MTTIDCYNHLNKEDLQRYNRQIIIPEFGEIGQQKLKSSAVLIIGAGGLGAPILQYLTAAGVGRIGIVDFDEVSISNLQRQVLFNIEELDLPKAKAAADKLQKQNPGVQFEVHDCTINSQNALRLIAPYDLVVDGSDNLATRYLVNDACFFLKKTMVYGAIFRFEGQLSVFNTLKSDGSRGPNYRDLFPSPPPPEMVPSCSEGGVLGVLPGIIGSMMANETIKLLVGMGESLSGKLFVFDALDFSTFKLNIEANPDNPISGKQPTIKELIDYEAFCMGEVKEATMKEISVQELKIKMDSGLVELIDVREDYEYKIANLGGKLIPLNMVVSRLSEIPRDKEVVVVCKMGGRSKKAIELLQKEGFNNLINLKGGITSWQKEIDPSMSAY